MNVLFISWDGPQVSYLEGLFLPIFTALRSHGINFHVMQFTWADADSIARTRETYEAAGIGYQSIRVHRFPKAISAVLTAAWGGQQIRRAVKRHHIDVIMPRSIMPSLATLLAPGIRGIPIAFDADGLPIDERVEFAGQSPGSLQQRALRRIESMMIRKAQVVLTRTFKASEVHLERGGPGIDADKFHVVGNGRDARMFRPFDLGVRANVRARLGISDDAPLLVYAGSIGLQYCPEEMIALFESVRERRPDARLLVLSRSAQQIMEIAERRGVPGDALVVLAVPSDEVPEYLACADLGIALRTPGFSMQAVAPIKLGEYLLCGLPVVASTVIGGTHLIDGGTGFLMDVVDRPSIDRAATWFVDTVLPDRAAFRMRCNALGQAHFSLEDSVAAYLAALQHLAPRAGSGVLYIAYDGMLEPLGQSQVLAYLELLAADRGVHLLSFEKAEDWADTDARTRVHARMSAAGIHWHPRRYHKRPSAMATAWDIGIGTFCGLWLILRHRLRIIHARSYVAAVMALALKRLTGAKFIFDMRGFWADERVDGGLWPRDGRMYRVAKWFERRFMLSADHLVSLTQAAVREVRGFDYLHGKLPPSSVIPTCADLSRFVPTAARREGFVLGYVGSAGTWYLFDAVVACFAQLLRLRPEVRLLVINRNEHDYIRERLAAGGVSMDAVELRAADHSEIPAQMARMNAGIFFYRPSYSRAACSPTKLGEFLGCGIPCLSNTGVGDMAGILESERVGVALSAFDALSLRVGLEQLIALTEEPDIQTRCRASAERHFSLVEGVKRYRAIYDALEIA